MKLPTKPPIGLSKISGRWWLTCVNEYNLRTAGELQVLSEVALSLDRIAQCGAIIKKDGLFVESQRGKVSHPGVRIELQHRAIVLQGCRQLGISSPTEF